MVRVPGWPVLGLAASGLRASPPARETAWKTREVGALATESPGFEVGDELAAEGVAELGDAVGQGLRGNTPSGRRLVRWGKATAADRQQIAPPGSRMFFAAAAVDMSAGARLHRG